MSAAATAPATLAVIVEGHGEVRAVPVLLRRLAAASAPERHVEILPPIRVQRSKVVKVDELERYLDLAAHQLADRDGGVVVLLDADDDCAVELTDDLRRRATAARPAVRCSVVVPVHEFEAWFLASAASLRGQRGLRDDLSVPDHPESVRDAKGWLQQHRTDGRAYGPTVDQPALAALFDLDEARRRARSFDKLWRDVERLIT